MSRLFFRNILLGVKTLLLHKLRSLLTMLGVVFGVGSVIAMLSVGEGLSRDALERIEKLGTTNIIVDSIKPVAETSRQSSSRSFVSMYGLKYADEQRLREQFPMVIRTVPVRRVPKQARVGERMLDIQVVGTTPEWFELVQRPMLAGRDLTWEDFNTNAPVCVLTEYGARRMLAGEHTIGQTLLIGDKAFEVVGIVQQAEDAAGSFQLPDRKTDAYIPLTTCRNRFGEMIVEHSDGSNKRELVELHQIIAQVNDIDHVRAAAAGIGRMLDHFHEKQDFELQVPLEQLRMAEETRRTMSIVLGSIAGISLLVGGIGIMNIMLASVTERTREIGIRRAIGARKRQIVAQFLTETVVLSAIGGLIGVGFGLLVPMLITAATGMPTVTPMYSIVLSLGISAGVGVVFGLYPAARAANLDPIVALRHE